MPVWNLLVSLHICIFLPSRTPGGDKVSMLTHTYPHKPLRKILKRPYAITRLTAHLMCDLMSDLVTWKFRKNMVMHDTERPYWDQVPWNNTKPCPPEWYIPSQTPQKVWIGHLQLPGWLPIAGSYVGSGDLWRVMMFMMSNTLIKSLKIPDSLLYPNTVWNIIPLSHNFTAHNRILMKLCTRLFSISKWGNIAKNSTLHLLY